MDYSAWMLSLASLITQVLLILCNFSCWLFIWQISTQNKIFLCCSPSPWSSSLIPLVPLSINLSWGYLWWLSSPSPHWMCLWKCIFRNSTLCGKIFSEAVNYWLLQGWSLLKITPFANSPFIITNFTQPFPQFILCLPFPQQQTDLVRIWPRHFSLQENSPLSFSSFQSGFFGATHCAFATGTALRTWWCN